MSWLNPGDYARDLLNSERPDVLELAKYTSLCPRIEPLLMRNMRLKFLSGSEPELEYQLWFSRIVAARSTRNIVLDQAAARLLADELKENQDLFLEVWHDTQAYTVHWSALDKLEQQLRYESLLNNQPAINKGLQKILRHISRTQDEEARLNFARWLRGPCRLLARKQHQRNSLADSICSYRPGRNGCLDRVEFLQNPCLSGWQMHCPDPLQLLPTAKSAYNCDTIPIRMNRSWNVCRPKNPRTYWICRRLYQPDFISNAKMKQSAVG